LQARLEGYKKVDAKEAAEKLDAKLKAAGAAKAAKLEETAGKAKGSAGAPKGGTTSAAAFAEADMDDLVD